MPPTEYLERHTDLEHRVWLAFFEMKAGGFKPDISMAGCVPPEVQRRWERGVGAAGYKLAAGQERRIRAKEEATRIARQQGRPMPLEEEVLVIYDRLTKAEQISP